MTGNFIHPGEVTGHVCQKPTDVTNVNLTAVWQCECSKRWQLRDKGNDDLAFGERRPPIWQRLSSQEYVNFFLTQERNKQERRKYGH